MQTTEHQGLKCPTCGCALDYSTCVTGAAKPKPGDYSVCIRCAQLLRYAEPVGIVAITIDEVHPASRRELVVVRTAVAMRIASRN